jgi:hypothetical protein
MSPSDNCRNDNSAYLKMRTRSKAFSLRSNFQEDFEMEIAMVFVVALALVRSLWVVNVMLLTIMINLQHNAMAVAQDCKKPLEDRLDVSCHAFVGMISNFEIL